MISQMSWSAASPLNAESGATEAFEHEAIALGNLAISYFLRQLETSETVAVGSAAIERDIDHLGYATHDAPYRIFVGSQAIKKNAAEHGLDEEIIASVAVIHEAAHVATYALMNHCRASTHGSAGIPFFPHGGTASSGSEEEIEAKGLREICAQWMTQNFLAKHPDRTPRDFDPVIAAFKLMYAPSTSKPDWTFPSGDICPYRSGGRMRVFGSTVHIYGQIARLCEGGSIAPVLDALFPASERAAWEAANASPNITKRMHP